MAHLLSCCGTPALFIDAGDSQHGLSGAVTPNDVLIAMSKGGQTSEVIILAHVTKEKGAKLISITENPQSDLGQMSDVVLKIVSPDDIDPYGMIATGSSLINSAVSDALCVVLLHQRGYSLDEFGKTHPGGAVGRKLEDLKTIER
jgi:arabinose-5-phosphate isomerase